MIIKLKKRNIKFALGLLLIVLSLLTLSKQQWRVAKEDMLQYLMTMDLGFSHRMNLVDVGTGLYALASSETGALYQKSILPSAFNSIPKIIKYKVADKDFERIDIDIKHIDYQQIMRDRSKAIKNYVLSDHTVVKAKIRFKGKRYKAKLRLKGDRNDHWLSKYRMSFRVQLKGKNTIFGYKKFSIHKPYSRYYPYDYSFQSMMRGVGNLAAAHSFAHVYVNGTDWGIMDIEEHMSKEFLEKQKRKESAIIRFANEKIWKYGSNNQEPYLPFRISDPTLYVHLYGSGKYLKNVQYRKMFSYISKHSMNVSSHLYDVDSFAKAYVLGTAWGHWHALLDHNSKYYFNPYTLKLEPITTDQLEYLILGDMKNIGSPDLPHQYWSALSTRPYKENLPGTLRTVGKVVSDTQKYLDDANQFFPVDKKKNGKIIMDNMKRIISNKNIYLDMPPKSETGKENEQIVLPTYQQASEFEEHLHVRHYADGRLELYNLLPEDVIVKDILYKEESFLDKSLVVPGYLANDDPIVITTPHPGIQDDMITVKTEYKGFNRQVKNKTTLVSEGIENPLLLDTVQGTRFLKKINRGSYAFERGEWVLNKPVIVNGDLLIPSGVNIKFSHGAYLIVKGALTAIGGNEPIVLEASLDSWKGIYVINGGRKSHLSNVIIKNIKALEDGLLKLTGGITFYKSDVDLNNVKIEGVQAEDAINIVESAFTMNSVTINNTISDGLDSDYSQGTLSQSVFSNIGGDAMDFSGSNAEIDTVKVINVKDKAVSGGEKSVVRVKNSFFNGVGVGIASKDGSDVLAIDTSILNYQLHAAMSYIKKDFYGIPRIKLIDCHIDSGDPYIRQKGTTMVVDNSEIPEIELNVDKLYQGEVMRK